jgi:hypothetical protein
VNSFVLDAKLGQTTIICIGKKDNSVDLVVYGYVLLSLYAGFRSEICFAMEQDVATLTIDISMIIAARHRIIDRQNSR